MSERPSFDEVQAWLHDAARDYDAVHHNAMRGIGSTPTDSEHVTKKGHEPGIDIDFGILDRLKPITAEVHQYAQMLADETSTEPPSDYTPTLMKWLRRRSGHFLDESDPVRAWEFCEAAQRWAEDTFHIANPKGVTIDLPAPCQEIGCDGHYRVWVNQEHPVPWFAVMEKLAGKEAHCIDDDTHVLKVGAMRQVAEYERRGRAA